MQTSVLRKYLGEIDKILECPTAQRLANRYFDYTVIIRFAGAQTDLPWYMTYRDRPGLSSSELRFAALPLLIEEDSRFYNQEYDDGSFANLDQFSARHSRYCNLGYLDGGAGRFRSPKGAHEDREELNYDHTARELRLYARGRAYEVWGSNANEFGWVNKPR
jgi:hypothetical protein